ncbi:MAG: transposase, partial [Myxococcales bacterium]|nr:transposase [Myxococcales bacterium]
MRRKRRNHSPAFKAKVALTAIAGELTTAEMTKKFDVHAHQITTWKKQLVASAPDVFGKPQAKLPDAPGQAHSAASPDRPTPLPRETLYPSTPPDAQRRS